MRRYLLDILWHALVFILLLNWYHSFGEANCDVDCRRKLPTKTYKQKKQERINRLSSLAMENKKMLRLNDEFNSTNFTKGRDQ